MTLSQLLKLSFLLGSALLIGAVFLFTHQMISGLSNEIETTSRVLARFCAQASFPASTNPEFRQIFSEVIGSIDFPIVITDGTGTPRAWRGIGVDPALVPATSIDSMAAGREIPPEISRHIDRVRVKVTELDRKHTPITMMLPGSNFSVGAVHYGEPAVLERLRWMPLFTLGSVVVLLLMGLWGLAIIRQAEKRIIWVGMAKETAHQLGTPLSSLMGWAQLLRSHVDAVPSGTELRLSRAELAETVSELERDIERLNKVAQRFSHVGSAPQLQRQDVTPVVREVVHYMRRRMPKDSRDATITERYEPTPEVDLNPELLEWALENLISNAINAFDKRPAQIDVSVAARREGREVEIAIKDNGRGMSPREQRRAFEPGYTTRRRGWGLGLALARRVVQDYHRGKLSIRQSAPGVGTTLVISLPARG